VARQGLQMSLSRGAFAAWLAASVVVACGSDDDDDDPTGSKGGRAAAGKSGASGKGGSAGVPVASGGKGGKGGKGGAGTGGSTGGTGGSTGGLGGSTSGSSGAGDGGGAGAPLCFTYVDWTSSVQSATISYADPTWLVTSSSLSWDLEGNPGAGSVRVVAPFSAEDQLVGVSLYRLATNLDGWTVALRVKLRSGLTDDAKHPGAARLVVKSGFDLVYAAGAWVDLEPEEWVTLRFDPTRPEVVDESQGPFEPVNAREIAVELGTGPGEDTTYTTADMLIDDLGACQLASGGAGGTGGSGGVSPSGGVSAWGGGDPIGGRDPVGGRDPIGGRDQAGTGGQPSAGDGGEAGLGGQGGA
jgi:hypothetical protein